MQTVNRGVATNVLVADDDDEEFMIFSMAVADTELVIALTRAEDGEVLTKILEESLPDILFLDILMPCKNGRECLRDIRSNKRYDDTPVIIYSSLSDLRSIEYCFREGANLFVVKPSTLSELTEVLKRILQIDWKKTMYYPRRTEFVISPPG